MRFAQKGSCFNFTLWCIAEAKSKKSSQATSPHSNPCIYSINSVASACGTQKSPKQLHTSKRIPLQQHFQPTARPFRPLHRSHRPFSPTPQTDRPSTGSAFHRQQLCIALGQALQVLDAFLGGRRRSGEERRRGDGTHAGTDAHGSRRRGGNWIVGVGIRAAVIHIYIYKLYIYTYIYSTYMCVRVFMTVYTLKVLKE